MREQSMGDIRFGTLARAAEGLTQWRPLLMSFLTLLVFSLLIGLGVLMGSKTNAFFAGIFMLIAFVALLAGSSAVGIMLMDQAKNEPIRSFTAAASAGLLCLPKFILVGLIVFAATLVYSLFAAIIYFVCKIPFLGGILAFVAHPILVLVAAALLIALIWVIGPLMGPALWSGLSVKAALANVLSIARKRLVEVVLMEVVLYIILTLICVMLFAGLMPATVSLTAMAIGITADARSMGGFGDYGGYGYGGGMFSSMQGLLMGSGASTGLVAGLGVLFAVVGALLAQVAVMGMNLIYLQASESVDPEQAQDELNSMMGDVRKKAEEAKVHAKAAAERTMAAAERAKQAASERLQEATAKNAPAETTIDTAADTAVNPEPANPAPAANAANAAAAVAAAGFATTASDATLADRQAQDRAAAAATAQAQARQVADEEAARLRTEAEVARVHAEAQAAHLKAQEQAQAEAQAQAQLQAQQAQAERAIRERAEAQAAEAARQRAQAEADERAAAAQATQAAEKAAEEAREKADVARRASELQAQREAEQREAERQEAAAREAARVKAQAKAQAEAEEKARQAQLLTHCPVCKTSVAPEDVFCEECGNKLK